MSTLANRSTAAQARYAAMSHGQTPSSGFVIRRLVATQYRPSGWLPGWRATQTEADHYLEHDVLPFLLPDDGRKVALLEEALVAELGDGDHVLVSCSGPLLTDGTGRTSASGSSAMACGGAT